MDESLALNVPSMARSLPTGSFHKNAPPKLGVSSSLASNHGLAYLDLGFRKRESPLPKSNLSLLDTPTSFQSQSNDSETQTTLQDKMVVSVDEPVGSLSISPRNRDVCLGACVRSSCAVPKLIERLCAQTKRSLHPRLAELLRTAYVFAILVSLGSS